MIDGVVCGPDPDVSEVRTLPELLEETPPGPELAALLAGVDRAGLGADDLLRVAAARSWLIAHQEAQLLAEITVPLTTLLGVSKLPGELAGFGPVTADITRQVITQMHDAQWRYSIFDPLRRLVHHGVTSARPDAGHQTARRPAAVTAAFVKARDRVCLAPGCRRPARRCDIDHTLDWVKGGETVHCNLACLCKQHHLSKHVTGCSLEQLSPGVFIWNTPAGLQYLTRSETPLLDDNILAGLPKPASPDTALLLATDR